MEVELHTTLTMEGWMSSETPLHHGQAIPFCPGGARVGHTCYLTTIGVYDGMEANPFLFFWDDVRVPLCILPSMKVS